jgi:two-component system, NarL family, nitrate/nitrite response regulator NarL
VIVAPMDDARTLLQGLVAWLATVDDVRLLGAADTVLELLETATGSADVVVLDVRQAGRDEPPGAVRQLASDGHRVVIISVIAPAGTATDPPPPPPLPPQPHLAPQPSSPPGPSSPLPPSSPIVADATRPHLAPQERAVLLAYASGMTLVAAARHSGVRPATAKVYLERVKEKYRQAGRPTYTKLDLAARVQEDGLSPGQD